MLACERIVDLAAFLEINEISDVVVLGEAFHELAAMLEDASLKVIGHADVDRAGAVGQDVNVVGPSAHGFSCC